MRCQVLRDANIADLHKTQNHKAVGSPTATPQQGAVTPAEMYRLMKAEMPEQSKESKEEMSATRRAEREAARADREADLKAQHEEARRLARLQQAAEASAQHRTELAKQNKESVHAYMKSTSPNHSSRERSTSAGRTPLMSPEKPPSSRASREATPDTEARGLGVAEARLSRLESEWDKQRQKEEEKVSWAYQGSSKV